MINKLNNFIFVHIPKCAGTSIEKALFPSHITAHKTNYDFCCGWDESRKIWMQHATACQIKYYYCEDYESYFKFAIVRNPWDRALSDYFWQKKELGIEDSFKNFLLLDGKFDDQRLKQPIRDSSSRVDHILPQTDFLFDENGKKIVDFIGTVETIREDFVKICKEIGVTNCKLPHNNKTKHKHYSKYYDEELIEIVREKYKKDIELFGYRFDYK